MKRNAVVTFITLVFLLAIAAVGTSAQTPTSTVNTTTEPDVAVAPLDSHVKSAAAKARFSFPTPGSPSAQGAGSTQNSYVMFRAYVFKVHRSNGNPAIINSSRATGNVTSVEDFDYGTEWAGKLEAGWNSPATHFGFRVAYFRTVQKANIARAQTATGDFILSPRPLNVIFTGAPDTGTTATFEERLRMHVIDLEGSYKWASPTHSIVGSAGLRIAPTRQEYEVHDIFAGIPELLEYKQRRTGLGPTGAVDLRYHLGSGFWVTGMGRVAFLWGSNRESARYTGVAINLETRNSNKMTPVFEGEGGLEWSGGGGFFVNGSFMYHHWHNSVIVMPTPAVGTGATQALDNPAAAPTRRGSVSFIGGVFSAGFRF